MRRLACILLCMCVFCSCSSSVSVQPITSGFRCQIAAEYEGLSIAAELDRTDPTQTVLTFTQPEELQGVTMICSEDGAQIQFMGMSFDVPDKYSQESLLLRTLVDRLDAVCEGEEIDDPSFEFDPISGVPLFCDLPNTSVRIAFSQWEFPE